MPSFSGGCPLRLMPPDSSPPNMARPCVIRSPEVLEPDRRLVELAAVAGRRARRGDGSSPRSAPTPPRQPRWSRRCRSTRARIGFGASTVPSPIHDAEAVGVAVGGETEVRPPIAHRPDQLAQVLLRRLRRMAAEHDVPGAVEQRDLAARLLEQAVEVAARRPVHDVDHHAEARRGGWRSRSTIRRHCSRYAGAKSAGSTRPAARASAIGIPPGSAERRDARLDRPRHLGQGGPAGRPGQLEPVVRRRVVAGRDRDARPPRDGG